MAGEAEMTSEQIDALARDLYHRADQTGIWECADYLIQHHFRREAARRLQQQRYTKSAERL